VRPSKSLTQAVHVQRNASELRTVTGFRSCSSRGDGPDQMPHSLRVLISQSGTEPSPESLDRSREKGLGPARRDEFNFPGGAALRLGST